MSHNLAAIAQPRTARNYTSASAAATAGNPIDATGFDRCMVVYCFGSAAGDSTFTAAISKSTTSNGTYTAVTGASFTLVASSTGYSSKNVSIDFAVDGSNPFYKTVDTSGVAAIEVFAVALLYRGVHNPWTASGAALGQNLAAYSVIV